MRTVQTLAEDLVSGPPRRWRNVDVVPLHSACEITPVIDYMLAATAMRKRLLSVTEVDHSGRVQTLRARNHADVPVLLLDGEELCGAKQNRILNCDVLLRPHGEAMLPVSCVEQGRWRYRQAKFVPGHYSPARLRARKSRAVRQHLRAFGTPQADQGEVWDDVAELLGAAKVESPTAAMGDAAAQREDELKTLASAVPWVSDAVGVVVYIEGRFAGMDVFDQPQTLRELWDRLLGGYALDALAGRVPWGSPRDPQHTDNLLTEVAECPREVFAGVDMGEDWRLQSATLTGSALVLEEQILHMCVFPCPPERREPADDLWEIPGDDVIDGPIRRLRTSEEH